MNWEEGLKNLNKIFPPKEKILRCVLGNESCDLDSFISSLILSIKENRIHLINIKYKIFIKKLELLNICKIFNIKINKLLFYNKEINKIENSKGKKFDIKDYKIKAILTDHNNSLINNIEIEEVYDHHLIINPNQLKFCKKIFIDLSYFSCCSLIYNSDKEYYLKKLNNFNKNYKNILLNKYKIINSKIPLNHILLLLLFITIIIDSIKNNSPDKIIIKKLKKKLNLNNKEIKNINKIFKPKNINNFLLNDLLIDYKLFIINSIKIGTSTIRLNNLINELEINKINEFFLKREINKYFIMILINKHRYCISNLLIPENKIIKNLSSKIKEIKPDFSRKKYIEFLNSI